MKNGNCNVCKSKDCKKIERHALEGKMNFTAIAKRYNVSYRSIKRHLDQHIPVEVAKTMVKAMPKFKPETLNFDKAIPVNINNLKACLEYIYAESLDIHLTAKKKGNGGLSLHALKQAHDCVNTAMKGHELLLSYEAQGSWEKILPNLLAAVEDNPEAKLAISMALRTKRRTFDVGGDVIQGN